MHSGESPDAAASDRGPVGVIGLGTMGRAIADALISAGYGVVGFDRSASATQAASAGGVRTADSVHEVVKDCLVTLACVTGDAQATNVALGATGVIAALRPESVYIDCTTVSRARAEEIGREFAARGLHYLDAPLSLHPPHAVFFVGGSAAALELATPVLEALAVRVCHLGGTGAGAAGKLLSQYATYSTFAADADAIRAAAQLELDVTAFIEGLRHGSAQSWILECAVAGVIPDPKAKWGAISVIQKDLEYTQALASDLPPKALTLLEPVNELFQSVDPALRNAPISTLAMNRREGT